MGYIKGLMDNDTSGLQDCDGALAFLNINTYCIVHFYVPPKINLHGSSFPHCLSNLLGYQTNVHGDNSTCINQTAANDGWFTGFLADAKWSKEKSVRPMPDHYTA